ncbi:MAG: 2-C-methyl-D-erythritol 4-phosphate cytidylyltransferase, partial [Desulfopila sp.]|nr:2-C-methyl-D-erythritol 4-phosphate cytidylyltransferase [Desulfopila sp.]
MKTSAAAIIPAAGSGTRMKAACPKQYILLDGKPILVHAVSAFHRNSAIQAIIVAVPEDRIDSTRELLHQWQLGDKTSVIAGGLRRQDSVKAGLDCLDESITTVLVHDGARPLVSDELISRCLDEASLHGAAIAAIPVKDTLKRADGHNVITGTVDRTHLWQAQTPQAADVKLLRLAFEAAGGIDATDEASLLERAGIPVRLVRGSESNIKTTQPEDLIIA